LTIHVAVVKDGNLGALCHELARNSVGEVGVSSGETVRRVAVPLCSVLEAIQARGTLPEAGIVSHVGIGRV
jgi:hypothetical protein